MRGPLVFLLLLVGACANGAQADLLAVDQARSLAAEWALVNQRAADNKLTSNYANTMRASIREQLQEAADTLGQHYSPAPDRKEPRQAHPVGMREADFRGRDPGRARTVFSQDR